jgi:hypothetical protein
VSGFLSLFSGIWMIVGLTFLIAGIYMFTADRRFAREAQVTNGTVLSKDVHQKRDRGGDTSRTYSVRYRFTAPDGAALEGESDVDYERWRALVERAPVRIAFLPSKPSTNRVEGTSRLWMTVMFTLMGGLFAIAGAVIGASGIRSGRRAKRLRESGLIAEATVTAVEPTRMTINGRRQGRVAFEFRDYQGRVQTGRTGYLPLDEAMRWKAGDRVAIRYNRDRPAQSLWDPEHTA